jgi:hypothetical protein
MEQYIPKSVVLAEIEKRKKRNVLNEGAFEEDIDILSFINTLETKEVDLDKHLKEDIEDTLFDLNGVAVIGATHYLTVDDVKEIAKHFFELGIFSQLTWQDIELIAKIGMDFMNSEDSDNLNDEEYYTEILNRFKVQKENIL